MKKSTKTAKKETKKSAKTNETLEKNYMATVKRVALDEKAPAKKSMRLPRIKTTKGAKLTREEKAEILAETKPDVPDIVGYLNQGNPATESTEKKDGKMSGLDAAAKVLTDAGIAMNCADIVKTALDKGYWTTNGKTPAATIYAAIIREIAVKGTASRFAKAERGMFKINQ